MDNLLEVENLVVNFNKGKSKLKALRDISFSVKKGETLCIVGESGSGKSITILSVMALLAENGEIENGSIKLNNEDLIEMSERQLEKIRGNKMSMIFQDPMMALNPTFTIGFQLREPLIIHQKMSKREASKKSIELIRQVGIPSPEERLSQYPHELSGGMKQRIMIAMAFACEPSLLLADEPTTALDVTIQAQILDLIVNLKRKHDMGVVFVTHDMGVVAEIADRVIVMYAGEIVEEGVVDKIFDDPQHPYTKGLLESVPLIDKVHELGTIKGSMPNLDSVIPGCRFNPRCPYAMEICRQESPPFFQKSEGQKSKCWLHDDKIRLTE